MFGLLKPAPLLDRLPAERIDPAYRRLRCEVFAGIFIGYAALFAIGFLIYGPIMIIGLHALDLVAKKAAGTAAGFTGFFGYVFGSSLAGTGVGWIADRWSWNGVFIAMVVCCLATIFFSALPLSHRSPQGKSLADDRLS